MVKSIYKITNLLNGKIYIGQSKNPEIRFKDHINGKKGYVSLIHQAIKKYGKDNFSFEIIEKDVKNYNEREKYWINYYHSTDRNFGYNILPGGECPPVLKGEESCFTKYSDALIEKIQFNLYQNKKSYLSLATEYNVTEEYIGLINRGKIRKNSKYEYPIRKNSNARLKLNKVLLIIYKLDNTSDSIEKISRELEVGSNVIYEINKGLHFYSPKNLKYPLREKNCKLSNKVIHAIIGEIKNNRYKFSDIEKMYNISKSTLSKINNGRIYRQKDMIYPIRTSKKRVYNL